MILRSSLILMCATVSAAAQNMPPPTGAPCLQVGNIAEYHGLPGNRSLLVIDKLHRQYRVDFTAVCDSLQVRPELGFRTFNPSQYACLSRGDNVYSSRDVGANRLCRIQTIEFYIEEPPGQTPAPAPHVRARG